MEELSAKYGARIDRASFTWDVKVGKGGDWVPVYSFPKLVVVKECWTEYTEGLGGHLPTRELELRWKTGWRKGATNGTYWRQRLKVVGIYKAVKRVRRWSDAVTLHFFQQTYPRTTWSYVNSPTI